MQFVARELALLREILCHRLAKIFMHTSHGVEFLPTTNIPYRLSSTHPLVSIQNLLASIISALASYDCRTIHEHLSTRRESQVATNTTDHRSKKRRSPFTRSFRNDWMGPLRRRQIDGRQRENSWEKIAVSQEERRNRKIVIF